MTRSLKNVTALALAAVLAAGALSLAGCGEQEQQGTTVQSAAPAASDQAASNASSDSSASTDQASGEQDNCYGDDLPVINTNN